jgi:hypothetical protein
MLANIVTAIKLRGKTQWRMGADCGLSPSQFSAVIAERRTVDPWLKDTLAKLLDADPEWLFQSFDGIPSVASSKNAITLP